MNSSKNMRSTRAVDVQGRIAANRCKHFTSNVIQIARPDRIAVSQTDLQKLVEKITVENSLTYMSFPSNIPLKKIKFSVLLILSSNEAQ